jgi:hypothetical protein
LCGRYYRIHKKREREGSCVERNDEKVRNLKPLEKRGAKKTLLWRCCDLFVQNEIAQF